MVFGRRGLRRLHSAEVEGEDPLMGYHAQSAADLRRLSELRHCGDIVVISSVDDLGMVHAFEGLVGSHGGLGGEQNLGVLLHPSDWDVDADLLEPLGTSDGPPTLIGAPRVHEQLVRWRSAWGAGPTLPM